MSIIDSLKRLERAGSENSRTTKKLREAAADVAGVVEAAAPVGVTLPRGYWVGNVRSNVGSVLFLWSPTGTDECGDRNSEAIDGNGRYLHGDFNCMINEPSRETILRFARDIAEGWLDELSEFIERRAEIDAEATATLEAAKTATA